MAVTSDDNVPGAPGDDDDAGETTAATKAPAAGILVPSPVADGAHEDDRTVQRNVDARLLRAEHAAKIGGTPAPRDARAGAGVRMTSKKATVQGLGMPGLPSRRSQPPPPLLHEAEEADDSITATAPVLSPSASAVSSSIVPKPSTGVVRITELEEEGDETEVRTVIAAVASATPGRLPRPVPAAGRPPAPTMPDEGPDAIDDSVTAQAPAPVRSPADDEPKTQPPVLSPASPARSPAASTVDDYDTDESVTGRAPAVPYDDDDSVTSGGPAVPATPSKLAPPRIRVLPTLAEDEPPDNRTAVMANAPVKPFPLNRTVPMQGSAVVAAPGDPSSDSGLRIAPNQLDAAEKASVNVLLAGMPPPVHDTAAYAATAPVFSPLDPASLAPAAPVPAKASSYALIVGVVAGASVAIPLVVYLALRGSAPVVVPADVREPATFEHEPVGIVDEARTKAARTLPPAPSTTTTAKPPWWRRR